MSDYEVVGKVSIGFAPSRVTGGNRGEQSKVFISQRDKTVLISHSDKSFPVGKVEYVSAVTFVVNIVLKSVSAGPVKLEVKTDVHLVAFGSSILTVSTLYEVCNSVSCERILVRGLAVVGISLKIGRASCRERV